MRLLLVCNPRSGGGHDAAELSALLRDGGASEVDVLRIDDVDGADASEHDRVVVAAGDGTVARVAQIAAAGKRPLAVLPAGTANDFARALDLPLDLAAAARVAASGTHLRAIDLLDAGGTPFVNTAAAGLSVHATQRAVPLKPLLGPLAYTVGALRAGLTAAPVRCRVEVDGERLHDGPAWQVIVAGTGAFGGGAELDGSREGRLDVAVLRAHGRAALVRHGYAMRAGTLSEQDDVARGHGTEVVVHGPRQFNVDGDVRDVDGGRFGLRGRVQVVVG